MTSLSAVLLANPTPPQRAGRVYPRSPAWLLPALNEAYEPEIAKRFGGKLRNIGDADEFLRVLERGIGCKLFDHRGSDGDGNFVSEPYARHCAKCRIAAAEFAERLGVRLEVSELTHHAPGFAIRFTFHKSEVRW